MCLCTLHLFQLFAMTVANHQMFRRTPCNQCHVQNLTSVISILSQSSRFSLSLCSVTLPEIYSFDHRCAKTSWQMKKGMPTLKKELKDIGYVESHPEVHQMFKDAGCYNFCKKLQSFHQQVALNFDGKKAIIDWDEFEIDEALIDEVTELPMTGEKWFKMSIIKNVCY